MSSSNFSFRCFFAYLLPTLNKSRLFIKMLLTKKGRIKQAVFFGAPLIVLPASIPVFCKRKNCFLIFVFFCRFLCKRMRNTAYLEVKAACFERKLCWFRLIAESFHDFGKKCFRRYRKIHFLNLNLLVFFSTCYLVSWTITCLSKFRG